MLRQEFHKSYTYQDLQRDQKDVPNSHTQSPAYINTKKVVEQTASSSLGKYDKRLDVGSSVSIPEKANCKVTKVCVFDHVLVFNDDLIDQDLELKH